MAADYLLARNEGRTPVLPPLIPAYKNQSAKGTCQTYGGQPRQPKWLTAMREAGDSMVKKLYKLAHQKDPDAATASALTVRTPPTSMTVCHVSGTRAGPPGSSRAPLSAAMHGR